MLKNLGGGTLLALVILVVLAIALGSCQGNVDTKVLSPAAIKVDTTLKGVIFYPPQYVKVTHSFTTLLNDNGQVIADAAGGSCTPIVEKEEITIMPDLGQPMLISNSSGHLSSAKFAVSLKDGMLESVNSEPTQKPSEVLAASFPKGLPIGATALRLPTPPGRPACNAGSKISGFTKVSLS